MPSLYPMSITPQTNYRDDGKREIVQLKSEYRMWHTSRIAQHRIDETYFNRTFNIPTPPENPPLYLPTARNLVNDLVNHLIAEIPIISVLPRHLDEKYQKQSATVTNWVNGYWHQAELTRILRQMLLWDAIRGCHVMRVLYDAKAWPLRPLRPLEPDEPDDLVNASDSIFTKYIDDLLDYQDDLDSYEKRLDRYKEDTQDVMPIITQILDPQYVFWEPVMPPEEPKAAVISYDRPIGEIARLHPEAQAYLDWMKPNQKVQWNEWWSETEYAYWIESYAASSKNANAMPNWIQEPRRHGYGFFPLIIDGPWVTPLEQADRRYPSIYEPIRSVLQYESTLMTQMAWVIKKNSYAPLKVFTDQPEGQRPEPNMRPGGINYLDPSIQEDMSFLEMGGSTVSLLQQLVSFVDEEVQKGSSFGDVMKGNAKGKSGYQQAQIAAMARVALTPLEHCVERTLRTATKYVLKLVPLVGERISVLGITPGEDSESGISEKDVKGLGPIKIKLKTVLPIDESAKIANYLQMNARGMLSAVTAARMSGVENPEEEASRAAAEQLLQEPDVKRAMALQWASEHYPELLQWIEIAQQMRAGEARPEGPGGPPPPGAPKQGPPGAPGGPKEAAQVHRQARQGGMPKKKLGNEPGLPQLSGEAGGLQ